MRKKDQSTEFLKECIADALFELIENDDYEKITVSEIVAKAGVSRATYYRHFLSKDEVLLFKFYELTEKRFASFSNTTCLSFEEGATLYFEFIYTNKRLISLLYKAGKRGILEQYITNTLITHRDNTYELYKDIGYSYFLLGFIYEWIQRDFAESPEELQRIITYALKI